MIRRNERGFITVQVLGVVVFLLIASGTLVALSLSTVNTTRESRAFTQARGILGQLQGEIDKSLATLPNGPIVYDAAGGATVAPGFNSSTIGPGITTAVTGGSLTWSTDVAKRDVSMTSTARAATGDGETLPTSQSLTLPVRGLQVASQEEGSNGVAYGVPAGPRHHTSQSALALGWWGNAVTTESGDSHINGNVLVHGSTKSGTWAVTGGSVSDAAGAHVVAYSDGVNVEDARTMSRSRVNAYMDHRISDQLQTNARSDECAGLRNFHGLLQGWNNLGWYACNRGDTSVGQSGGMSPSGSPAGLSVSTNVIRGDLRLGSSITSTATQMHLYVDGDVEFGDGSGGTVNYTNVFIYAPNGTCRAAANTTVNLIGSLACKTVELPYGSNTIRWVAPKAGMGDPYQRNAADLANGILPVDAPQTIHFFERPGYIDHWNAS